MKRVFTFIEVTRARITWGNEFPQLNNYKFNKVFGGDKIGYLSKTYLDSPFVYECDGWVM